MQALLSFVVKEQLADRGQSLNETSIAQAVFKKGADFNPKENSISRVSVRRLRKMLGQYYEVCKNAHVKIIIPIRCYQPVFEYIVETRSSPPKRLNLLLERVLMLLRRKEWGPRAALTLSLLCAVFVTSYNIEEPKQVLMENTSDSTIEFTSLQTNRVISNYPLIAVPSFQNKIGIEEYNFLETELQKQLITDLGRFQLVRPVSYEDPVEFAFKEERFNYVISVLILAVEPEIDILVKLTDRDKSEIVFQRRIKRSADTSDYFDGLASVVRHLSSDFAGSQGAIVQQRLSFIEEQIDADINDLSNLKTIECVALARKAIFGRDPDIFKNAYLCLEDRLKSEPDNATLLSFFGYLNFIGYVDKSSLFEARTYRPNINLSEAIKMMKRAVKLHPNNAMAHNCLSVFYHNRGEKEKALKHAELAYLANPGDMTIMNILSILLATDGQWERAISLSTELKNNHHKPQPNFYRTEFLLALHNNDKSLMQITANKMAELDHFHANKFLFMAAVANNDEAAIETLRPKITELAIWKRNPNRVIEIGAALGNEDLVAKSRELFIKGGLISESGEVLL